jgi:Tol biopolymer transport system component
VLIRTDAEGKRLQHHIAVIPGEGGTPQLISVTGDEYSPFWSPDGTRLAYLAYDKRAAGADIYSTAVPTVVPAPGEQPPPPILISEADLWIVNADGTDKYNATQFMVGNVGKPRWSPAGDLLAFEYSASGNNDTVWMIGSQRGAFATQLSSQSTVLMDMSWLPDGTGIIGAISFFLNEPENRLWQIPLVGQAEVGATRYLESLPLFHADYPRFSPDGQWLAVRSEYRLVLIDLATKTMTGLDERMTGNTPAVWSPTTFTGEEDCAD